MKSSYSNKKGVPHLALNEVRAYECHVRGLTKDSSSGVKYKGTFAGVIEKLDDIKALGFNQLILMPVYEYQASPLKIYGVPSHVNLKEKEVVGAANYWGFKSGDYFHAKAYYGTQDADQEFLDLIDAAHAREMEIVMMMHFDPDGDTQVMLDALNHWVRHFHVDGFFLNVNSWYLKVISDQKYLKKTKLYVYELDRSLPYTNPERIAVYDPAYRVHLRKMLRGDEDGLRSFADLLTSRQDPFTNLICAASHNGFTLADLYSYSRKHNEANGESNKDGEDYNFSDNCGVEGATEDPKILQKRLQYIKNAICMLFLSNGLPVFLAGDEEGNSQGGNNNAYCQDNAISWIQYGGPFAEELKKTVKDMIALRMQTGLFQQTTEQPRINYRGIPAVSVHGSYAWDAALDNVSRHAGFLFANEDRYLYVCVNFEEEPKSLAMPHLPEGFTWKLQMDTAAEAECAADANAVDKTSSVLLTGHSVKIFSGIRGKMK